LHSTFVFPLSSPLKPAYAQTLLPQGRLDIAATYFCTSQKSLICICHVFVLQAGRGVFEIQMSYGLLYLCFECCVRYFFAVPRPTFCFSAQLFACDGQITSKIRLY
jgi:hypothetical protein